MKIITGILSIIAAVAITIMTLDEDLNYAPQTFGQYISLMFCTALTIGGAFLIMSENKES